MHRLPASILLLASMALAEVPWLPRVARSLQGSPGWKVSLVWTSKPAPGSIASPRSTQGELRLATDDRFRFVSGGI